MVVVYLWIFLVVTYVVLGENLKAKAWERSRVIVSSHLLLDKTFH